MRSGPNWYQIRSKARDIFKVSKFYIEKGYLCKQARKCLLWHENVYFTDKNLKQRGDLMELNFESLEMKHTNR